MVSVADWVRTVILLAWLFSPPVLALICVARWRKSTQPLAGWKRLSPLVVGTAVLANWVAFAIYLATGWDGGVGTEHRVSHLTFALVVFSLVSLIASVGTCRRRWSLLTANILLLTMWFVMAYSPGHWLARVDEFSTVTVDDRAVPAIVYIGNPRLSEAEEIALIHVPTVGDYFFDFGEEMFREASQHEFIPLHYGVWTWKPMIHGQFRPPLPSHHINECRIPLADGRVVTVPF